MFPAVLPGPATTLQRLLPLNVPVTRASPRPGAAAEKVGGGRSTCDMSGRRKLAKRVCGCPLDGRVRRHWLADPWGRDSAARRTPCLFAEPTQAAAGDW